MRLRPSPNWLLLFVPVSVLLEHSGASPALVFFAAALAIVPAARLIVQGTEHIAARTGSAVGGLLNATFGNLPELIIATVALQGRPAGDGPGVDHRRHPGQPPHGARRGAPGGRGAHHNQEFNAGAARVYSSMMLLAVISLAAPGAFERVFTAAEHLPQVHALNVRLAVMLLVVYVAVPLLHAGHPRATSSPVKARPATAMARARLEHAPRAGHAGRGVGAGGVDERDPGRRRRGHRRGAGDVADLHRHDHRRRRGRSRGESLGHRRRRQEQAGPDDGHGRTAAASRSRCSWRRSWCC